MSKLADAVRQAMDPEAAPEGTEVSEATGASDEVTPSSSGEQVLQDAETNAAETSEAPEGTDETPGEWFGVSLEGVPAEVVQRLEEQNKFIQKLLREKTPEELEQESVIQFQDAPEPEPELTDEDILRALGLDPDDPFDEHTAKVAIPLVQRLAQLESQVNSISSDTQLEQTQRYWDSTLDAMEQEYGSLGIDRLKVIEFAVDNDIAEPQDAYWRIAGPTRVALWQELQKRTAELATEGKRSATTTRPRTSADTVAAALSSTNTKDAVAEAAKIVAAERGFDIS